MTHIPVLQKEVLEYLNPKPDENFIDATIDGGGHGLEILERIQPDGKLLGVDLDEELLRHLKIKSQKSNIKNKLILVCDNYINLKEIVERLNFKPVNGILLDLGMSSYHLEKSGRGFSFQKDEPLDMRYSNKISNFQFPISNELTAAEIINKWSEKEIERILKEYGEEKFSKRIAKAIIEERRIKPIKTTFQLVEIIKKAIPSSYQRQKKLRTKAFGSLRDRHFATRTFQALRIAVNDELNNLKKVLPQSVEVLEKGGRLVIISFHSLEDRIVKNFFRELSGAKLKILTKKPIRPTYLEIKNNPRSRSAKLRAAEKL
jgi:16S rRNA (cytosine1402-N4)-methyltransferase